MSFERPHHFDRTHSAEGKGASSSAVEKIRRKTLREARVLERERRQEELFRFFVTNAMLSRFEDDLDDLGLDSDQIEQITTSAANLSFEDLYTALSYPYELREVYLGKILARIREGGLSLGDVVPTMAETAREHGFSIGFHMSKFDIPMTNKQWAIIGKEPDHRDSDLPMAYYAREFKSLYRRRLQNYLYIVRAEATHRVGDDKKWWRAPTLSIVQKISVEDLRKAMLELEEQMQQGQPGE